jgi:hypothetical protein
MPDLNNQTLINLLIDSPLREPIKINLIDIVNNTNDADLPKTFTTITKELEIFQKATERRMKLADETVAKLKGESAAAAPTPTTTELPPLPPLPVTPTPAPVAVAPQAPADAGLAVPPLDLPPMPTTTSAAPEATPAPVPPVAEPVPAAPDPTPANAADEDALKEIQKELDALKSAATEDLAPAAAPAPQA